MGNPKKHTVKNYKLRSTRRASVRAEIFKLWIKELPGTSKITNTYRYNVEQLSDKSLIYLTRPTRLNKGADFVIHCQNYTKYKNRNDRPPRHRDLFKEFSRLARTPRHKKELRHALGRIWNCEKSTRVIADLVLFKGHSRAERVLLLAKWFFIEQDVTYWTQSGRHMLRKGFEIRYGKLE